MAKYTRIEIVTTFKPEENLLLILGSSIKKINEKLNGKFIQLNIPNDAPLELPRFVIQLKNIIIQFGMNRIQIISEPPVHIQNSITESFKFIEETSKYIISTILENDLTYSWTGIVTTIEQETKSSTPLIAVYPIFKKMINLKWNVDELASFSFQIGRKIDGKFVNYTITGYEKRDFKINTIDKKKIRFEEMKNISREIGIQVLLDINNKPEVKKKGPIEDLNNIIMHQLNLSKSLSTDLNLGDILT